MEEFAQHIATLQKLIGNIMISPFYDFLYDDELQSATLRYTVDIIKKMENRGGSSLLLFLNLKMERFCAVTNCHAPWKVTKALKKLRASTKTDGECSL
ncbi:hypothetical protein [Paenibacillus sp. IHB B 3084]|uniref:hypothetical protein n=1 Tax=Paenibacillus sp. IHB B 3084 TaxID=867076 RepID=UPI000A5CB723|nr:hypothetical protein [Paenibacillus sp. IHB B 3084]